MTPETSAENSENFLTKVNPKHVQTFHCHIYQLTSYNQFSNTFFAFQKGKLPPTFAVKFVETARTPVSSERLGCTEARQVWSETPLRLIAFNPCHRRVWLKHRFEECGNEVLDVTRCLEKFLGLIGIDNFVSMFWKELSLIFLWNCRFYLLFYQFW